MTCVIGFTDREKGISWIGADSLGSNGYTKETQMPSKVFRNETFQNVLMGGTTTFRHLDLLKYATNLFDEIDLYKKTNIDHVVSTYYPADEDGLYTRMVVGVVTREEYEAALAGEGNG